MAGVCDDGQTLVPRPRPVERRGPDPQGAHVRADRRREGNHGEDVKEYWWYLDSHADALVDALALPLPAARVPLRASSSRRTPAAASSTPEYELVDTGVFDEDRYWDVTVDYAKAGPHDLCMRVTVENRGPDDGHPSRAADAVVPQHLGLGRCAGRSPTTARVGWTTTPATASGRRAPRRVGRWCRRTALPRPLFCDNETNAAAALSASRGPLRRTPRTASTTTSSHGAADGEPRRGSAPRPRCATCSTCPRAATARQAAAPAEPTSRRPGFGAGFDAVVDRAQGRGRRVLRRARPRSALRRRGAGRCARPFAGLLWGKQFYHYDVDRWLRRRPGRPAAAGAALGGRNARLAPPQQRRRDLDARPVGVPVVRGLGPRPSTASPSPTSTRSSPRSSWCCCCASGTCTRTASCPPTSGRSATSTRRCTPGRRCGCSRSTARATTTSWPGCSTSCC